MFVRVLSFLLIFFAAIAEESYKVIPDKATLPLLNPTLKEQKTLKVQLANGVQAVLISDPHVVQSSVAITVMAGSWQDPDAYPGLAHFLEHMLFLGTKEYPTESEFERYLAEHGGKSNAFTHGDFTSYIFSIQTSGLNEAIRRVSSFFKEPLFNPSGVERELHAIDQEFAQGFNNETMRDYFVIKILSNPEHPVHRFQTGNSGTLGKASTETLRDWFEQHYSSNIMRVYVLSSLPLDQLRSLVVNSFSSIPNREKSPFLTSIPVVTDDLKGHFVKIGSDRDVYTLYAMWEIPSQFITMLDRKPDDVLCYVLGHEGKESLFAQLKREGLALQLGCGGFEMSASTSLFAVKIQLTAKGFSQPDQVLTPLFQTLNRLREKPFPQSLFREISQLHAQRYQYQQRDEPFEWATKQASWLAKEPIETFPELSQTIPLFDPKAISELLSVLTPENAFFLLSAPASIQKGVLDKKEPWMQIPYHIDVISKEQLAAWKNAGLHPAINLPATNPFVSYQLGAPESPFSPTDYPNIPSPIPLLEQNGITSYYMKDPFYRVNRTFISFDIQSPSIKDGSPKSVVLTDLYVEALLDYLNELLYDFKVADGNVVIERTPGSVRITVEGFSDSVQKFFPILVEKLLQMPLSKERFSVSLESLQREYENSALENPLVQTFDYLKTAIYKRFTSIVQKRKAIGKISFEDFKDFGERLFKKTFLKGMIVSSLSKEQVLPLAQSLNQKLHSSSDSIGSPYTIETVNMPNDGPFSITSSTKAQGDALLLTLEIDGFSPSLRNAQQILMTALSPSFFGELRTKQQTGYIVASNSLEIHQHLFNYFGAQSTSYKPQELLWRFEQFLEDYLQKLKTDEITPERFKALKTSIAATIQDPPPTFKLFGEQQFKLAFEIRDFDWMKKRLKSLSTLNYEEFIAFANDVLGRQNKRRLAILLTGVQDQELAFEYTPFKSISSLRAKFR